MRKQRSKHAAMAAFLLAGTAGGFLYSMPSASAESSYRSAVEDCVRSALPDRRTFDECVEELDTRAATTKAPSVTAPAPAPTPAGPASATSPPPLLKGTVTSGGDEQAADPAGVAEQPADADEPPADEPEAVEAAQAVVDEPPAAPPAGGWMMDTLARLRQCEASGNYGANTGNGYYGAYQFSLRTWKSLGLAGYPHQAIAPEQDRAAVALQARDGWGSWPSCSRRLGLR